MSANETTLCDVDTAEAPCHDELAAVIKDAMHGLRKLRRAMAGNDEALRTVVAAGDENDLVHAVVGPMATVSVQLEDAANALQHSILELIDTHAQHERQAARSAASHACPDGA